ncbi:HAD family hydrolase [Terasakiispira papahanaumokuakeensis]|uniref:3-deoxy-D-manno-octulosonate 8-phosphate phosphatase KdsC n=1 Tax=Terasakiispira papahanaumokuakeensis TaxID=197479 RepID=A0A1E2V746_9GAMM|nr:HAD family hydrolase [Terasakiispira papahanaumokuakeensis]
MSSVYLTHNLPTTVPATPTPQQLERMRPIRLLALDVDGVMTNGQLQFNADGSESKSFNTLDGHGIKLIQASGVQVAIITGRQSTMVTQRAQALNIKWVVQGREDKLQALAELIQECHLSWSQVAYCGDDLPDLPAIRKAGLGISVPNAPEYVRHHADWITHTHGGLGAVREITDTLMQAQGTWTACINHYLYNHRVTPTTPSTAS